MKTVDPHERDNPLRPFPDQIDLQTVTEFWLHERYLLIPKSRQILATWLIAALNFWECMFYPYRLCFFQSKKEEDSDENLIRVEQMYKSLPDWMKERNPVKKIYCQITFEGNQSRMKAVPQGSQHFRQYTPSSLFLDEATYIEELQETIKAVQPAIRRGGKLTAISSAGPSEFADLVFDRMV